MAKQGTGASKGLKRTMGRRKKGENGPPRKPASKVKRISKK
jgi:hypothetical protein